MNGESLGRHPSNLRRQSVGDTVLLGKPVMATIPARAFPKPERVAGKLAQRPRRSQDRRADHRGRLRRDRKRRDYSATRLSSSLADAASRTTPLSDLDEDATAKKVLE